MVEMLDIANALDRVQHLIIDLRQQAEYCGEKDLLLLRKALVAAEDLYTALARYERAGRR